MRSSPAPLVVSLLLSFVAAACCGAAPRTTSAGSGLPSSTPSTSSSSSTSSTSSAPSPKGTPRLDLHCTPQGESDEADCAATGKDWHFQPPLVCRGVQVSAEVREAERKAWEAGTEPCTCVSNQQILECSTVP